MLKSLICTQRSLIAESRIKSIVLIEESPAEPCTLSHMIVSIRIDSAIFIAIPDSCIGEIWRKVFHADDDRPVAKSCKQFSFICKQCRIDVLTSGVVSIQSGITFGIGDSLRGFYDLSDRE